MPFISIHKPHKRRRERGETNKQERMNIECCFFFFFALTFFSFVSSQGSDSCSSPLALSVPIPFDTGSLHCVTAWGSENFILRYGETAPNTWSYLLSAPNTNAYIGIGFSPDGKMVGSTAIVGWAEVDGTTQINKYFLGGQRQNLVTVQSSNQGLQIGNSSAALQSNQIYIVFQMNANTPSPRLIYAIGQTGQLPTSPAFQLTQHRTMISTLLNYNTGTFQTQNNPEESLKRSHGILNMLGWAILMPIGAMVARYMRKWDPLWFYAHAVIQSCAFILGVIGIICGLVLENRLDADTVGKHKALGIIILVLGCLQVMAVLLRPDKVSKSRKYWNLYHHNVGRFLVILAVANVFYGIHLANAGSSWNVGFAAVLVVLFVVALILELRMWSRD